MHRRYTAFLVTAGGGAVELFGALYGQGMNGSGALFGLLGAGTRSEATALAFLLGVVTIVAAVVTMFRRDARPLALIAFAAAVAGTLAAGPIFGIGAGLAGAGAILTARLDRSAPLV
jgi:hypothetical protein